MTRTPLESLRSWLRYPLESRRKLIVYWYAPPHMLEVWQAARALVVWTDDRPVRQAVLTARIEAEVDRAIAAHDDAWMDALLRDLWSSVPQFRAVRERLWDGYCEARRMREAAGR